MKAGQKIVWALVVVLAVLAVAYVSRQRAPSAPQPPAAEGAVPVPAPEEIPAEPPAPAYKAAIRGATAGEWTMDLDAAKALAAETGLPLLLNFTGSDWCGWCRLMDKQVFSQEAWKTYAQAHFVLAWIDFPQNKALVPKEFVERNTKLSQEFEVGGFPTFILLDSDGQTRLGQAGASRGATPESFIAELDNLLLASDKSIAALKEKMTDEQKAALDAAKDAKDLAHQKLEDWIGTEPPQTDENSALYDSMRDEIQRAEATYLDLLKSTK